MLDNYAAGVGFIAVAFFMLLAVFWFYGNFINGRMTFLNNIKEMTGQLPGYYYRIMWWFITPTLLLFIIIYSLIEYEEPAVAYGYKSGVYVYDIAGIIISYFCNFSPIVIILGVGLYTID